MASSARRLARFACLLWGYAPVAQGQGYSLKETYSGSDFFSHFYFWATADPSKGAVEYVSESEAFSAGYVKADANAAYIGPDMSSVLQVGEGRRSVRIQSRNAYNAGLFVARIQHAPTGCGVWPALWMYGEDLHHPWPAWGEFDVAEGVHDERVVRTTLHTDSTCSQRAVRPGEDFEGSWDRGEANHRADVCDIDAPQQFFNQGCSQRGPSGSLGSAFNNGGGGTYAAEWDPESGHIRTWFWPAGTEPFDLKVEASAGPQPETWGRPFSYFRLHQADCPPHHFANMRLVLNINFCGDLGLSTWKEGCPEVAKEMTCEEFVARNPGRLREAYWSISTLEIYQHNGPLPADLGERILFDYDPDGVFVQSNVIPVVLGSIALLFGTLGLIVVSKAELRRQRWISVVEEGSPGAGPRDMEVAAYEAHTVLDEIASQFRELVFGVAGGPIQPQAVSANRVLLQSYTSTPNVETQAGVPPPAVARQSWFAFGQNTNV